MPNEYKFGGHSKKESKFSEIEMIQLGDYNEHSKVSDVFDLNGKMVVNVNMITK